MGQKPSRQVGGPRFNVKNTKILPFFFSRDHIITTHNPNPEQPIKFQYKTKRKTCNTPKEGDKNELIVKKGGVCNKNISRSSGVILQTVNNLKSNQSSISVKNTNVLKVKLENVPSRTKSESSLILDRSNVRDKSRHKRKGFKINKDVSNWDNEMEQFGYEIGDVDAFLTKATLDKPANIPVVLAFPSTLYQTRVGGYQAEISLPLGMVVNAVFKNQHWLYVQTPHAEEGYVGYAACLPLGIIPPPDDDKQSPCWEKSTDVFPKPSGNNLNDTEKLTSKSDCGAQDLNYYYCKSRPRQAVSTCGEKSVDSLYLKVTARAKGKSTRQTLLVIIKDFDCNDKNALSVEKGEVVFLLNANVRGWLYVRNKDGDEGFIPAAVAGHGFL